jgi:hypothetical protein
MVTDARTPWLDEPQPRLRLRFALYTGIVLLAAGLAIAWLVNREVAQRAGRTVQAQARAVALRSLSRKCRVASCWTVFGMIEKLTVADVCPGAIVIGVVSGPLHDEPTVSATLHCAT